MKTFLIRHAERCAEDYSRNRVTRDLMFNVQRAISARTNGTGVRSIARLLHGARYLGISDIIFPKAKERRNKCIRERIYRSSRAIGSIPGFIFRSYRLCERTFSFTRRVESRRISMHGGFRYPISSERGRYISAAFRPRSAKVYGEFLD